MSKHKRPNISIQDEEGDTDLLVEVWDFRGIITITDEKVTVVWDKSPEQDRFSGVAVSNCIYVGPDLEWRLMRQKSRDGHSYEFELDLHEEKTESDSGEENGGDSKNGG